MTLSNPLALSLLAMAAPIIWFFLRRPPAPLRAVSSLLLARAMAKIPRRRKQLAREDLIPLLLMILALGVGVGAMALSPDAARDHLVVVVDDADDASLRQAPALAQSTVASVLETHAPARTTVIGTAPPRLLYTGATDEAAVLDALKPAPQGALGDPTKLVAALCRPPADSPVVLALTHLPLDGLPTDCPVMRPDLPAPPTHAVLDLTASAPSGTGDAWLHSRVRTDADTEWRVLADGKPIGTLTAAPGERGVAELLARVTTPPGATT